ncbi:unnamed protein product [Owenia fusiformis]|uniref:Uncharacterized protein n=1 Tax=Owenia fusiformis TaxID=6347 RepID=A0A8S4N269_OWEFU|nr:unnamed protein product [Owenia fusiformis]
MGIDIAKTTWISFTISAHCFSLVTCYLRTAVFSMDHNCSPDHAFTRHIGETHSVVGKIECGNICLERNWCGSFNIEKRGNTSTRQCQINRGKPIDCTWLDFTPGFLHFQIEKKSSPSESQCPDSWVDIKAAYYHNNHLFAISRMNPTYPTDYFPSETLTSWAYSMPQGTDVLPSPFSVESFLTGPGMTLEDWEGDIDGVLLRETGLWDRSADQGVDPPTDVLYFIRGNNVYPVNSAMSFTDVSETLKPWPKTLTQVFGTNAPSQIDALLDYDEKTTYLFKNDWVFKSVRPTQQDFMNTVNEVTVMHIRDPNPDNVWIGAPTGITAISPLPSGNVAIFVRNTYYLYSPSDGRVISTTCVGG